MPRLHWNLGGGGDMGGWLLVVVMFFGLWSDLENLLDRRVDLVTEGSLADFARESVERDKILIYERAA